MLHGLIEILNSPTFHAVTSATQFLSALVAIPLSILAIVLQRWQFKQTGKSIADHVTSEIKKPKIIYWILALVILLIAGLVAVLVF